MVLFPCFPKTFNIRVYLVIPYFNNFKKKKKNHWKYVPLNKMYCIHFTMLSARLEIKAGNFILNLKVGGETTFALSVGNVYIDTIS